MEISVSMGKIKITHPPHLLKTVGLGSCMAVILYDPIARVGSLAHIVLPSFSDSLDKTNPDKFSDMAIKIMIKKMNELGALVHNIRAQIFGGANMFPEIIASNSDMDIGQRNIRAVKDELQLHNINIIREEVGGSLGRTVLFNTHDGQVEVRTAEMKSENIRKQKYAQEN